jgi:hypothetical protein
MSIWWYAQGDVNMLTGVEGDPDNPPKLSLDYIIQFLKVIPAARRDFELLYPNLTDEEKDRLAPAISSAYYFQRDYQVAEDNFQKNQNTVGIHTAGPYGGGGRRK